MSNQYPPGYPQPGYPQPGPQPSYPPPQGAQVWPPAPAQPQWGGPPAGAMPGPQAQQAGPAPSAPPALPQVDPNLVAAAYQRAREEHARLMAGGGGKAKFLTLTPPGVKDWINAPVGAMVQRRVFLVPSKVPGALPFTEDFTHFWKGGSKPQGNSVPCLGPERCPVCIGRELVQRNVPDEQFKKHVRDKAKVRRQVVYQVLALDNPPEHQHEDGQLRPLFVRLGLDAHNAIGEKFGLKGLHTFFDPQHARVVVITKRKTGDSMLDVETTIDDLDPVDVHPWFWGVLQNTHDFAEIARDADQQKFALACQEMSLPMHDPALQQALMSLAAAPQQQGPASSYNPNPNPPNASPYPQAQQPTFGGAAANVQQWQTGPGHTGNTPAQPMQQQWQGGPPQPPAQGYPPQQAGYGGPPQGYPQPGPQVPANVPPGLANTMMGRS